MEREIMAAVVRTDMWICDNWRTLVLILGLVVLAIIKPLIFYGGSDAS